MRSRFPLTPEGWFGKLRRAVVIVACGLVAVVGGCGGDDGTQSRARLPEGGDPVPKPNEEHRDRPSEPSRGTDLPDGVERDKPTPTPTPPNGLPEPLPEPEPTPELPEDPEPPDDPADSDLTP